MGTNAERIVAMLMAAGVERLFGMPGGGSSSELIQAAGNGGLPFSLAHTETASAIMAAAQAEITGRPGVCLATLGPGAASLVNGVAHAHLDRVPLFVLTDCLDESSVPVVQHQALPHGEMFSSIVKWSARPSRGSISETLRRALIEISSLPPGPVHLDVSSDVISSPADDSSQINFSPHSLSIEPTIPTDIRRALEQARYPVALIGLGARTPSIASAIRIICDRIGIPALVTYKAKGVVPDKHPWFGGVFTNAALERNVLERADIFLAIGLDPVELLPRPWTLQQPVISFTAWPMQKGQIPIDLELIGDVSSLFQQVAAFLPKSKWAGDDLRSLVEDQLRRMRPIGAEGDLLPHRVVELVAAAYPGVRATVDAGAHMFPVMSFWPACEPGDVLISNGLSTMGFAVPAAIGAALLDTSRTTVAFTGDGGMLMCLGELRTAARENLRLRIIVFADGELSLIKIKQEQRGYPTNSTGIGEIDWPTVATGFGVLARQADSERTLMDCLRETADHPGPVLIAARISAATYPATMRALRG